MFCEDTFFKGRALFFCNFQNLLYYSYPPLLGLKKRYQADIASVHDFLSGFMTFTRGVGKASVTQGYAVCRLLSTRVNGSFQNDQYMQSMIQYKTQMLFVYIFPLKSPLLHCHLDQCVYFERDGVCSRRLF